MRKKLILMFVLIVSTINTNAQYIGVGINNPMPEADLDVTGSVRLEHPSQATDKVLISNSKGGVKWASPYSSAFIRGYLDSSGVDVPINTKTATRTSITVPPGAFVIKSIMLLRAERTLLSNQTIFANIYLSDSSTNPNYSNDYITNSAKEMPGSIIGPMSLGTIDGSIGIKNTTTGNKTYYLWVQTQYFGTATAPLLRDFSTSGAGENTIYAIPIN